VEFSYNWLERAGMTMSMRCVSAVVVLALLVARAACALPLTQTRSCYRDAHEDSGGLSVEPPRLNLGGYHSVDDPAKDEGVAAVLRLAVARLDNDTANSYRLETTANRSSVLAFKQVCTFIYS